MRNLHVSSVHGIADCVEDTLERAVINEKSGSEPGAEDMHSAVLERCAGRPNALVQCKFIMYAIFVCVRDARNARPSALQLVIFF